MNQISAGSIPFIARKDTIKLITGLRGRGEQFCNNLAKQYIGGLKFLLYRIGVEY